MSSRGQVGRLGGNSPLGPHVNARHFHAAYYNPIDLAMLNFDAFRIVLL